MSDLPTPPPHPPPPLRAAVRPRRAIWCSRTERIEYDRGYVDAYGCESPHCSGTHHVVLVGPTCLAWRDAGGEW